MNPHLSPSFNEPTSTTIIVEHMPMDNEEQERFNSDLILWCKSRRPKVRVVEIMPEDLERVAESKTLVQNHVVVAADSDRLSNVICPRVSADNNEHCRAIGGMCGLQVTSPAALTPLPNHIPPHNNGWTDRNPHAVCLAPQFNEVSL